MNFDRISVDFWMAEDIPSEEESANAFSRVFLIISELTVLLITLNK